MMKKIFILLSLIVFALSIYIVAAPPPGDRTVEDKCHRYCKDYKTAAEYNACYSGCMFGSTL